VNGIGEIISGSISNELSEDDIFELDRQFKNKFCAIHLMVRTKIFKPEVSVQALLAVI